MILNIINGITGLLVFGLMIYIIVKPFLIPTKPKSDPVIRMGMDQNGDLRVQVLNPDDGTLITQRVYRLNFSEYTTMGARLRYNRVHQNTGNFWQIFLDLDGKSTDKITKTDVINNYKRLAMQYHPDKPSGSQELMKKLNRAKDEALKVVK